MVLVMKGGKIMEENEETPTQTATTENATQDNGAGNNTQTTPVIEEANLAAERMERAAASLKEQSDRLETLQVHTALGGRSEAGAQPVKEEPISDIEFAQKVARGEINPLREDGFK